MLHDVSIDCFEKILVEVASSLTHLFLADLAALATPCTKLLRTLVTPTVLCTVLVPFLDLVYA